MKRMTLTAAIRDYFGPRGEGQSASEWLVEIKALTPKDRDDLKVMLAGVGYEIVDRV